MAEIDLYCRLYVRPTDVIDAPKKAVDQFSDRVAGWMGVKRIGYSMEGNYFQIAIEPNDSFEKTKAYIENDFVYFPFLIEVEPTHDATDAKQYIEMLSLLISAIRLAGCTVVAACGFEDEIPMHA